MKDSVRILMKYNVCLECSVRENLKYMSTSPAKKVGRAMSPSVVGEEVEKTHRAEEVEQPSTSDAWIPGEGEDMMSTAVRQRINVGWMAQKVDTTEDIDRNVCQYSQRLGCQMYNFISYPIGGVKRGFWTPGTGEDKECPPPIDLPDVQLENHLWETYVNGQLSSWIDCDSEDEHIAALSEREILKELNYVTYMGLRSVVIQLKRADSPRLAAVLNKWLWTKHVTITFWVFVPTSLSSLIRNEDDPRDIWTVWADFRTLCTNYCSAKLIVGLHLSCDIEEEFMDTKMLARWKAEPLAAFLIDSDAFVTDSKGRPYPPVAHAKLLSELWQDSSRIMVRPAGGTAPTPNLQAKYVQALRYVLNEASKRPKGGITDEGFLADGNIEYMDILQAPLQPLADNLDSNVYNTFEQDPVKYNRYREAVEAALKDLAETKLSNRPEELVLYVLGAGRGPLVTASLQAGKNHNELYRSRHDRLKLKVIVVEKNPNAMVTLRYMNERKWNFRCQLVESDMRSLPALAKELNLPQPDIIVSELLGSFGDNELSPECLDGVTPLLKPTTISIPQTYTSYAAPIMSLHMYQTIISGGASYWNKGIAGNGRTESHQMPNGTYQFLPQSSEYDAKDKANMDQIYVVFLRQFCPLAVAKPVFTFDHPNMENKSNERSAAVEFEIDRPADVMGFAGYFHMNLYKDVTLSIVPETHSKRMISWFPALIPLRKLERVQDGDKVTFNVERKLDSSGVWYEWSMTITRKDGSVHKTELQNKNGDSYYMKLL